LYRTCDLVSTDWQPVRTWRRQAEKETRRQELDVWRLEAENQRNFNNQMLELLMKNFGK
jgi:hypothetical protein